MKNKFYTAVYAKGDKIYLRGFEDGKRIDIVVPYAPYLFIPTEGGFYRTITGQTVDKIVFKSMYEARDYIKRYADVTNFAVYGLTTFQYLYLYDNYLGEIDYDPAMVSKVSIDIECAADEGFPNIKEADKEITAITLRKNGFAEVFGCGDFVTDNPLITYFKCEDEVDLLYKFIEGWKRFDPDIITGWNIDFFDIPYLINRMNRILESRYAKSLSPWGLIETREVETYGKISQTYLIHGVAILDYYQLYRKFKLVNQESYKLDYIAEVELGEKKLDYSEYGSLLELYRNNFQKFIEYNIRDTVLVDKLDDKLKYIEQVMAIAYDAKVTFNDTLATVRPWDIIIHNYLLDRRIVIPQPKRSFKERQNLGGYVKDPKLGVSKWVVSFDLNSLYPHLIMQYNISPEMFMYRNEQFPTIEGLLRSEEFEKFDDRSYAANGSVYSKKKQGFLPALMQKMYDDRVVYKQKMLEAKKEYEKNPSKTLENLIARYHNFQLAKKIQLNSAYGALSNEYFRWFDIDHAEAITASGQLSVRWVANDLNKFMNKAMKTTNKDYIVYIDTDSVYIELADLVAMSPETDEKKLVGLVDRFCEEKIQPVIERSYENLREYMSAYDQKMIMKRETIASKGIWTGKKRYILNAWNVEGVQYDKPKAKITGLEAVRSSTPYACRENIKKAYEIILNQDEPALQDFVITFREKFMKMPFEQISFPRGVNGITKYMDPVTIYSSGTPIHVKGSIFFNRLLKKHELTNIVPIQDGDKIKFAYLKMPNPIHDSVISVPDELPDVFGLDKYIDREKQFDKSFLEPLRTLTDVIGWQPEKIATLEAFFS